MSYFKKRLEQFKSEMLDFPWADKQAYGDWLSQTYYFVNETQTLLSLAAARSEKNSKLQARFIEHAGEEKGHDKLLLLDLKGLGGTPEQHPELPATSSFYQAQYYWIDNKDPRAFFGYIILLEGLAAMYGPKMCEAVTKAHGKPAAHFLRVHSEEDVDHIEKAIQEVENFDELTYRAVVKNFEHAAACYRWMLSEVTQRTSKKKVAA